MAILDMAIAVAMAILDMAIVMAMAVAMAKAIYAIDKDMSVHGHGHDSGPGQGHIQENIQKAKGEKVSEKEQEKMLKKIKDRYDNQTKPEYAGARLWIDAIIDPMETRKVISIGIDAANNAPIEKQFNPGVIQT